MRSLYSIKRVAEAEEKSFQQSNVHFTTCRTLDFPPLQALKRVLGESLLFTSVSFDYNVMKTQNIEMAFLLALEAINV